MSQSLPPASSFISYILADAYVVDFDQSCDANYFSTLIERVIPEFGIQRSDIIGISVNNTAVNPSCVRKMGPELLPCIMDVVNFVIEAGFAAFNATDLFGLTSYFAHRHKLKADAMLAGALYRVRTTAGTRFGSKLAFL